MSTLQHIHVHDQDITIYTDSSTSRWGVTDRNNPSRGRWKADKTNQIHVLELKVIPIGLQTYCKEKTTDMSE